ncbi:MAG: PspA/IM30 family protein [Pseudobacteriovorax sp.]|nr:PspA/IM30 family protein [Pseudobacteriovorax sp.]
MTIFSRIKDILGSNIIHMLDRAENPDKMVRLMIQEMEETLVEVKSSAAKLIAEKKGFERQISGLKAQADEWSRKAELAVSKEREDLARGALQEKLAVDKAIEGYELRMEQTDSSLNQLQEDIKTLNGKLEDAKQRQKSIIMRQQSLQNQAQIQNTLDRTGSAKAFAKFEQYEQGIDRLEGEVTVARNRGSQSQSLHSEIEELEIQEDIDKQLAEIKSRINKDSSTDDAANV